MTSRLGFKPRNASRKDPIGRILSRTHLYDTAYSDVAFSALRVEQFVSEERNGSLIPRQHIPRLRPTLATIGEPLAA